MNQGVTRLAPSPTGALHLGNARTFLVNFLLARSRGWTIHLRIEDLDGPRIKLGADQQILDDLAWLGISFDTGPSRQSNRHRVYAAAIDDLLARGLAYPCVCTRSEVERAASAPHAEDGSTVYPGTCRDRFRSIEHARAFSGREPAIRFRVDRTSIQFVDRFLGKQSFNPAAQLGDFVVRKSDGTAAYQLAVVIDDADAGVSEIVRGDDLLDSTPRQMMIYESIGLSGQIPNYTHLPLVVGSDGRRLAKRHGDTRISHYRAAGVSPERVVGLLARWSGMPDVQEAMPGELIHRFDLDAVPRSRIVFDPSEFER